MKAEAFFAAYNWKCLHQLGIDFYLVVGEDSTFWIYGTSIYKLTAALKALESENEKYWELNLSAREYNLPEGFLSSINSKGLKNMP